MVKVKRIECVLPNWVRVVNAARRTVGKQPINHEPSDKFKRKILLAEHSPIRLLEYDFTWEDIRMWVTTHIVRHHEGCEKFVHTQRTDLDSLGIFLLCAGGFMAGGGVNKALAERKNIKQKGENTNEKGNLYTNEH